MSYQRLRNKYAINNYGITDGHVKLIYFFELLFLVVLDKDEFWYGMSGKIG